VSGLEENTPRDENLTGEETAAVEEEAALGEDDDLLNIGQERVLELISYLVVNLVENPDDVSVDVVRRQDRDVYQVRVNEADLGKVIGKGGQTAQAMRVLLTAVSAHTDQRIGLEIVE
jgi:predicted RNA-binding protein YlqC (UPF0109 family)